MYLIAIKGYSRERAHGNITVLSGVQDIWVDHPSGEQARQRIFVTRKHFSTFQGKAPWICYLIKSSVAAVQRGQELSANALDSWRRYVRGYRCSRMSTPHGQALLKQHDSVEVV